jgi:PAS domain S-box-containing protein
MSGDDRSVDAQSFGYTVVRLVADDRGNYVEVNDEAVRLFGYSREELLRMSVWDLTPAASELNGLELWQQFIAAGEQRGEYVIRKKNGSLLKMHYRARANVEPGRHESLLSFIPLPG